MDLPSWLPSSLPSSFASFADAHHALDSVTKMVEADDGPSYRLGNGDPAIAPGRRTLQILRPNNRSSNQKKKSAQLDTKRLWLPHRPQHTLLNFLNCPLAPNLCVPPCRRRTWNDPEVARRMALVQERRFRWRIHIFNTLLILSLLAANPRRAMIVLSMVTLRHRQHWILSLVTQLMVVPIVSISFSINLASGPCVRCM